MSKSGIPIVSNVAKAVSAVGKGNWSEAGEQLIKAAAPVAGAVIGGPLGGAIGGAIGGGAQAGFAGTANTGGGGGGAAAGNGGAGGKGVVIIRYVTANNPFTVTGGTITTSGIYTIHTFNDTGSLVVA